MKDDIIFLGVYSQEYVTGTEGIKNIILSPKSSMLTATRRASEETRRNTAETADRRVAKLEQKGLECKQAEDLPPESGFRNTSPSSFKAFSKLERR